MSYDDLIQQYRENFEALGLTAIEADQHIEKAKERTARLNKDLGESLSLVYALTQWWFSTRSLRQ